MIGQMARRLLWSMPVPIKSRLSKLYRTIRPPAPRRTEIIFFPPDIDDVEELRSFLADTDVFGPATEEGEGYLSHALERFRITLAITPEIRPGGREIGRASCRERV